VVRIEGTLSSFFENKIGLKQGDPLPSILFNLALQKVIQSTKMVRNGIRIGIEQLNVLVYADDNALIGKNGIEIRKLFFRNGKHCQKVRTTDKPQKDKIYDTGKEKGLKVNKIGHLKIKNYKFERVENFKYSGVILNEENNNQIDLQERIKNDKIYFKL